MAFDAALETKTGFWNHKQCHSPLLWQKSPYYVSQNKSNQPQGKISKNWIIFYTLQLHQTNTFYSLSFHLPPPPQLFLFVNLIFPSYQLPFPKVGRKIKSTIKVGKVSSPNAWGEHWPWHWCSNIKLFYYCSHKQKQHSQCHLTRGWHVSFII